MAQGHRRRLWVAILNIVQCPFLRVARATSQHGFAEIPALDTVVKRNTLDLGEIRQ